MNSNTNVDQSNVEIKNSENINLNIPVSNNIKENSNASFQYKRKPNIVIIIVIVLAVIFIAYNFMTKVNFISNNVNKEEEEFKAVEIETGKSWGDKYAYYVQRLFNTTDKFDITYIDFNMDDVPEAVIKYSTEIEEDSIWVLSLSNNEVNESKVFSNASFRLVYSSLTDKVDWYIYIRQSDKYGAYTLMSKILSNSALDSDIKATNDREIANFNKYYVVSNYNQKFYEVKKTSFEDDLKTSVNNYSGYQSDVDEAIDKLYNDNKAANVDDDLDESEYLSVGSFVLHYGEYVTNIPLYENGNEVGSNEKIVSINKDGTITDGENVIKLNVYGTSVSLENGISFKVTDNDTFIYGANNGYEYKLKSSN